MSIQSNDLYTRLCQECGHRQESKPCVEYKGDSWKDKACKKCRSEALDYGSFGWSRLSDGSFVRPNVSNDSEQ